MLSRDPSKRACTLPAGTYDDGPDRVSPRRRMSRGGLDDSRPRPPASAHRSARSTVVARRQLATGQVATRQPDPSSDVLTSEAEGLRGEAAGGHRPNGWLTSDSGST
jgi:hypothetical protein